MFEHWKAYKNRQQDNKDSFGGQKNASRAESFASIVSVISQRMAHTKSQLSLRPGDIDSLEQLNFVNSKVDEVHRDSVPPPITKRQSTLSSSLKSGNYLSVPHQLSSRREAEVQSESASDQEDDVDYTLQSARVPTQDMPYTSQSAYHFDERLIK